MIGIYGGSFDPIHLGHLALARHAQQALSLEKVVFVPIGLPPHREQPKAAAQQRVAMLQAALIDEPDFEIDTVEIEKSAPSWTVNTLEYFHQRSPDETLCLLLGSDAFKPVNQWYRWRSLLNYCHVVVVSRQDDDQDMEQEVLDFLQTHRVAEASDLSSELPGNILWLNADIPPISSTQVREAIKAKQPMADKLPHAATEIIETQGLYL